MSEFEYKVARIKLALEFHFDLQIGVTVGADEIVFFHNTQLRGYDGGEINNKVKIKRTLLESCKPDCLESIVAVVKHEFRDNAVAIYCEIMRNED